MAGFASRLLDAALEDGDMRGPLSGMFPADLPVPSFASALAPLIGKLPKVEPNVGQLAKMAWRKAGSIQSQFPSLSRDECAAITLYTMEDMPRERSPYYVMNAALREKNRQVVRPWRDFVWLMLHALRKLPPSKARIVVRGSRGTASQLGISSLTEGTEVQWSAFSSTATKVDVMAVFLDDPDDENADTSGPRTMIHLELTEPIGRDVSAFSLHPGECEVLLPPNICFEVVSHYDAGSGLLMVQCRQTESLDALLDFGRKGDVPLGQPIDEVPMGVPADMEEELQAKMARLQKEAQRERDASRLIELGVATRERAIEVLERYGSLEAAANALLAAAEKLDGGFGGAPVSPPAAPPAATPAAPLAKLSLGPPPLSGISKPSDAAFRRLFVKLGGSLEVALKSNGLGWTRKGLDAKDATVVAYIVSVSGVLTELNLRQNKIGGKGAMALASALRVNGVLTKLKLDGHELDLPKLRGTDPVESLDLSSEYLGPASAIVIASLIAGNAVLTTLNLANNQIRDQGAAAIAEALRGNGVLTNLELMANNVGDEGATALASALRVNEVLTDLKLAGNFIYGQGAAAIAVALRGNGALTNLALQGNSIRDEGAVALASALRVNAVLKTIDLRYNSLGNEGRKVIRGVVSGREGFKLEM